MTEPENLRTKENDLLKELVYLLRRNIREYGMYIALVFIITAFAIITNGVFISPRNISTLID